MKKIYKILLSFFLLLPLLFISCEAEKEGEISLTSKESISEPSIEKSTAQDEIDESALEQVTVTAGEREEKGEAPPGIGYPMEEEADEFTLEEIVVTGEKREEKGEAPSGGGYEAEEEMDEFTLEEISGPPEEHELADLYKVELGADELIRMPGLPGELRVWIGRPDYDPDFPGSMVTAKGTLPAVGVTARITPFAPTFEVEPKESICMKIHPTGSEVRFKLKPTQKGIFNVGADVYLYESDDCSGPAIPKATTALRVEVKVDHVSVIVLHIKKLWEVFWEKLLEFWTAVIALFFALLLFLIRGRLKKWFGYK